MSAPARGTDAYRWWQQGALDEAQLRRDRHRHQPKKTRELLSYFDKIAEHRGPMTVPQLLINAVSVFRSEFDRDQRRGVRRALRGRAR